MLKNKSNILLIGMIVCVVLSSSLVLGGYKASKVTYTISGSVGLGGVTMKGLPGDPVTNADGYYTATVDYGWNGVAEPVKTGYTFEPSNRTYAKVTSNQGNQSYSASVITLTISGSTGVVGAVMDGLPGNPVTDQSGCYSATVEYGWKGTIVPVKEGCVFTPVSKQYGPVTKNQPDGNFTSKVKSFTLSGSTGVDGVVMKGLPGDPVTRGGGLYAATVDYGWKGVVTPEKEGYTFEPENKTYSKIVGNYANQSYVANLITLTISGNAGKSGVLMKGLPGDPVTDINGQYSATVNYGFSGAVTPTKEGLEFEPANKSYAKVTKNEDQQNYTAELLSYIVSGKVAADGSALSGVVLSGLPGEPVTNENGHYSAIVEYGWNGLIVLVKEGYSFKPVNKTYDAVTTDLENQTYNAELLKYAISGVVKDLGTPVEGARVSTKNGTIFGMTNKNGEYMIKVNYGYSGVVTASKEGYVFQNAAKSYDFVSEDQLNQNFDATIKTFTIAGNLGESGVVLNGLPGDPVTDGNGYYTATVDYGFSGTVTPKKEGYTFSPSNRSYTKVMSEQGNQNYNADLLMFTISGTVGVSGVKVSADNNGGSCTTDATGNYSITVPYGWSGTVTPMKEGYIFDPPFTNYTEVKSNIVEGNGGNEDERFVDKSESVTEAVAEPPFVEPSVVEPSVVETPVVEKPVVEKPVDEWPVEDVPVSEAPVFEGRIREERIDTGNQRLISNIFIDAELRQVLTDLSSQAGITIIPDQTVTGLISCELTDVPLDKALEIVLAGTGYMVKKTPDYYLVSSPNPKDAAFLASSRTKTIKLNYVDATTAAKLLSPVFKDYIQADPIMGAVVITAPPTLMQRIEADLESIDSAPRHVMLDARVVVMNSSDLLNLGVEWGWPKIRAGTFSNSDLHGSGSPESGGKWPWGVQIGYATGQSFTNSLELSLNLLERNGEATIVSSPQVLAQDGKPAEIRVTTEEYFSLVPGVIEGQSNSYYNRSELEKIEYGTVLNIVPHIGRNGDITLALSIEVSDVAVRSNDNYPVVTRRVINNTMRIRDGGTVTVAGLKKNESSTSDTSTPGLSRLPIVGGLFSNTRTSEAAQEVAIFVTAHLIRDSVSLVQPAETVRTRTMSDQRTEGDFVTDLERSLSSQKKRR